MDVIAKLKPGFRFFGTFCIVFTGMDKMYMESWPWRTHSSNYSLKLEGKTSTRKYQKLVFVSH